MRSHGRALGPCSSCSGNSSSPRCLPRDQAMWSLSRGPQLCAAPGRDTHPPLESSLTLGGVSANMPGRQQLAQCPGLSSHVGDQDRACGFSPALAAAAVTGPVHWAEARTLPTSSTLVSEQAHCYLKLMAFCSPLPAQGRKQAALGWRSLPGPAALPVQTPLGVCRSPSGCSRLT